MPYEISAHTRFLRLSETKSSYIPDQVIQRQNRRIASSMANKLPERLNAKSTLLTCLLLTQIRTVESCPARLPRPDSALTKWPVHCPETATATTPETSSLHARCQQQADLGMHTILAERRDHRHNDLKQKDKARPAGPTSIVGDFFSLPMAQASPMTEQSSPLAWDKKGKIFIMRDETAQNQFFSKILNHLVEKKKISSEDAHTMAFQWRQTLAGQPLYLMPTEEHSIEKRRSLEAIKQETSEHIEKNCAIETRITDQEGRTVAEATIFYIDEWQQFLTWPDSYLRAKWNGPPVDPTTSVVFDRAGFVLLLIPHVISMAFLKPISDWAKQRHYSAKGDDICRIVQNRALLEHSFSVVEIGSLGKTNAAGTLHAKKNIFRKPPELRQAIPVESNAIFYTENKQTGTQTELLLTAKKYTDHANQYEDLVLTKQGPSGYLGHHRHSPKNKARSRTSGIQIEYDDHSGTWFERQPPHLPLHDVKLESERTFVTIMGERYPWQKTKDNQDQIAVPSWSGKSQLLPVYKDPLSHSWHLQLDGQRPLFRPEDKHLIRQLKIEVDQIQSFERRPNENPRFYDNAEVIEVTQKGNPTSFTAVEMNGEVVPIKATHIDNHGIRYDTLSLANENQRSFPIVWDGDRWSIEGKTSRYLSTSLIEQITPSMYAADVELHHLSAPDQKGIRWDRHQNGYLRVASKFVRMFPESRSTLRMPDGAALPIVFGNGNYQLLKTPIAVPPSLNAPNVVQGFVHRPGVSGVHNVPPIQKKTAVTMAHFLENIWAESFENDDLQWLGQAYFGDEKVKIESVPSSKLETTRTIIFAKREVAVLDISIDGKEKKSWKKQNWTWRYRNTIKENRVAISGMPSGWCKTCRPGITHAP